MQDVVPRFDPSQALLLTGSPRSGTTWLGETLASIPGYRMLLEPFHPRLPGPREAGFSLRTFVPADADWPQGRRVFARYAAGEDLPPGVLMEDGDDDVPARAVVFKAVRVNRLLPWIVRHVPLRGLLYVVRHPCAVIGSQLLHPAFERQTEVQEHDRDYVERKRPELLPLLPTLGSEEEIRALSWSLDQHLPLADGEGGWLRVSYERLVLDGERELGRILEALGLPQGPRTRSLLRVNSSAARSWSADASTASDEARLGGWQSRLSRRQVDSILRVVEACGIRGFGEDPVPDFERLGFCPVAEAATA